MGFTTWSLRTLILHFGVQEKYFYGQEDGAAGNGAVGDVKSRPGQEKTEMVAEDLEIGHPLLPMEIKEVDDFAVESAIDDIAQGSA